MDEGAAGMIGAALAIGLSALGTAWAQARIGAAGTSGSSRDTDTG